MNRARHQYEQAVRAAELLREMTTKANRLSDITKLSFHYETVVRMVKEVDIHWLGEANLSKAELKQWNALCLELKVKTQINA